MKLKNKEYNARKNNRRRYNEKNCYHCEKIGHIRPNGPENRRIMWKYKGKLITETEENEG